jgi:hypothetical protein
MRNHHAEGGKMLTVGITAPIVGLAAASLNPPLILNHLKIDLTAVKGNNITLNVGRIDNRSDADGSGAN